MYFFKFYLYCRALVRSSEVSLVGAIAKFEIAKWNDLAKFLMTCTKSPETVHREVTTNFDRD
jgi:hypothetical protein